MYIGDPRPAHFGMIGIIDDIAVYNVALSETDIKNSMNPAVVSPSNKLVSTWAEIRTK